MTWINFQQHPCTRIHVPITINCCCCCYCYWQPFNIVGFCVKAICSMSSSRTKKKFVQQQKTLIHLLLAFNVIGRFHTTNYTKKQSFLCCIDNQRRLDECFAQKSYTRVYVYMWDLGLDCSNIQQRRRRRMWWEREARAMCLISDNTSRLPFFCCCCWCILYYDFLVPHHEIHQEQTHAEIFWWTWTTFRVLYDALNRKIYFLRFFGKTYNVCVLLSICAYKSHSLY